jgi:chromosome segregation ATPase
MASGNGSAGLEEVQDPISRAKLEGIQQSVYTLDHEIIGARKAIDEKRGVVHAADVIAKRLEAEMGPIQIKLKAEEIEPEEAKARIEQTLKCVQIVKEIGQNNRVDILTLQGQVMGFEKGVKALEGKFNEQAAKYERQQRMVEEEDELRAPSPTPPEALDVVASAPEKAKAKVGPTQAKKGTKKVLRKKAVAKQKPKG